MSDAILPLPKGERRIEIRDGALYLGLWSREVVVHWVKVESARIDSPDGEFVDVHGGDLLVELKQLRHDVGQLLGLAKMARKERVGSLAP